MAQCVDKLLVGERFRKALATYREHAVVQHAMAEDLAAMLARHLPSSPTIKRLFEIGAGSGALMEALLHRFCIDHYFANDLVAESEGCLRPLLAPYREEAFTFLMGDIEVLAEWPSSLEVVISNATVQWLEQPAHFFQQAAKALQPHGLLLLSSFGASNMQELSSLLGVGLRYHAPDELIALASHSFDLLEVKEEQKELLFCSPEAVLHHLRCTGVNGVVRTQWTKSDYKRFLSSYRERFSTTDGKVVLTYHPYAIALQRKG
uniref:Malonyl-[acyl-carrier protein] O-methyltransferase n=1 Tax=Chlorobium chlorochromatii (strain CaD3) TaxID=340177 RepID=Q3ANZ2_CHLCH